MLKMIRSNIAFLSKKLVLLSRPKKVALMLACDIVAIPLCFLAAMLLRLGDLGNTVSYGVFPYVIMTVVTIAIFYLSGLYRAVIRFIDKYLLSKAGASLAAVVLSTYFLSMALNDVRLPRTALMIYWFIAFSYMVSSRLVARDFLRIHTAGAAPQSKKNIAIFGAGEEGVQLALSMRANAKYRPVCFFDEKNIFNRHTVAGLDVFSSQRAVAKIAELNIQMIVLAIPSASRQRRRNVMAMLRKAGVPVMMLNSLMELSDDKISANALREVRIEDLLGRDAVPPQEALFAQCVRAKQVLVTGAGGSIGSELCRQIAQVGPACLILLDHSEFSLYTIEQELRRTFPRLKISTHLGSVCDRALVESILHEGRVDTIYHAAAYKHVPMVEANIVEGIRNNVVGADVLSAAARKYRVTTCVLISSDKAVRPTSIMGASKRIAELIFQAASESPSATTFCMVRFGNVLGSSGSVVPFFQAQIASGGPITITHPDITRYFMLIPEAAQLVMQAGAMATGGDVFVLDMGDPIRIVDLARTMIDLVGLTEKNVENPYNDIEIQYIGLRPGEKLHEELVIGSATRSSAHPRIMWTTEKSIEPDVLASLLDSLYAGCERMDEEQVREIVKVIVPEYVSQEYRESAAAASARASEQESEVLSLIA